MAPVLQYLRAPWPASIIEGKIVESFEKAKSSLQNVTAFYFFEKIGFSDSTENS